MEKRIIAYVKCGMINQQSVTIYFNKDLSADDYIHIYCRMFNETGEDIPCQNGNIIVKTPIPNGRDKFSICFDEEIAKGFLFVIKAKMGLYGSVQEYTFKYDGKMWLEIQK